MFFCKDQYLQCKEPCFHFIFLKHSGIEILCNMFGFSQQLQARELQYMAERHTEAEMRECVVCTSVWTIEPLTFRFLPDQLLQLYIV